MLTVELLRLAKVFKSWLRTVLTAVALVISGFITSIIFARGLGPEGRGLLASVMLIVTLAASVAQLGLGQSIVYKARAHEKWNLIKYLIISSLFIGSLGGVLSLSAAIVSDKFAGKMVFSSALLGGTLSAAGFTTAAAQIDPSLKSYNLARLITPIGLLTLGSLLFFTGNLTVTSIVLCNTIAALVSVFITYSGIKKDHIQRQISDSKKTHHQSYISLGLKYYANNIIGLILNNVDKIYFFAFGGVGEFGVYSVAFGTSRLLGHVQEAFSTALFSRYAGVKSEKLTESTLLAFRLTFFPMLLAAAILSATSEMLLGRVFGEEFQNGFLPFSLLTFECVISSSGWILAQQFNADGRPGLVLLRQLFSFLPLLIIFVILPETNIAPWLAGGLLAGSVVRFGITILMYKKILSISFHQLLPGPADFIIIKDLYNKIGKKHEI